jgi:hypothetical protein
MAHTVRWEQSGKIQRSEQSSAQYYLVIDPRRHAGSVTPPLLDLFPEPAAILNVWENKLALVKGERAGSVVPTER